MEYIYLFINVLAFIIYGIDKYKAIHHKYRVSEMMLIMLGALGPFGAIIGMYTFRHKTKKIKFTFTIPLFVILHIVFYIWFFID